MRSMWIICLSLMIPGASCGQQIQYLNYGDWVGVSAQERTYYIAGMIDGYLATDIGKIREKPPPTTPNAVSDGE